MTEWMLVPDYVFAQASGVPSLSPEHAVAIPSHGTAAGEAALGNASVASPLSNTDREV